MMVSKNIARTTSMRAGVSASDFQQERRVALPQEKYTPFREVALLSVGKGKHGIAADERAVALSGLPGLNLAPLDGATADVWRGRYDLVIAGAQDPRSVRDLFISNTEERLVRDCPSSVLIVRHRPVAPSRRIVVAIDPDSMDRSRTLLAAKTIRAAAAFAALDDSELHIVNVVPSLAYMLAVNAGLSLVQAKDLEVAGRTGQERLIHGLLNEAEIDRSRISVHLVHGNPVQKIANLVSRLDPDLLAIGSAGRRGITRLLLGNTAEKVKREVACSCLVVKP